MPELWTEDPRILPIYDVECLGRRDHPFYLALADELSARSIVDVGCGTGVFAIAAANDDRRVVGVDPSEAMIDEARSRAVADAVEWIRGTVDDVPDASADLVVMNGHVAQYFIDDDEWRHTLDQIRRTLVAGGHLAFESRNPAIDWSSRWTEADTRRVLPHPNGGEFTSWVETIDVTGSPASYSMTHRGHTVLPSGEHLVHDETLRFRSRAELLASLDAAGFEVENVWGDWHRTPWSSSSDEMIVVATARTTS